jgi:hypothetical protein
MIIDEYNSLQTRGIRLTKGDTVSTGHRENKRISKLLFIVVFKQTVCAIGERYSFDFTTTDPETEMYIVTKTDELVLIEVNELKKEQLITIDDNLTIVNFFNR